MRLLRGRVLVLKGTPEALLLFPEALLAMGPDLCLGAGFVAKPEGRDAADDVLVVVVGIRRLDQRGLGVLGAHEVQARLADLPAVHVACRLAGLADPQLEVVPLAVLARQSSVLVHHVHLLRHEDLV